MDFFKLVADIWGFMNSETRGLLIFMVGWFGLGFFFFLRDCLYLRGDLQQLRGLRAKVDTAPEVEQKRAVLEKWIAGRERVPLASWLRLVWQAGSHGSSLDAAALTESIQGQAHDRHYGFTYFSRSMILLGLAFTSWGLCRTLMSIVPAMQAVDLPYDAWVRGVQHALAAALGAMALAFTTSLLGILGTLVLNLLGTFLRRWHRNYVSEVLAFVQGRVIPYYAERAARDESDAVASALREVRSAIESIGAQYAELRAQIEDTERIREEMDEMRKGLRTAVGRFAEGVKQFGEHAALVDQGVRAFETTGVGLRTALMEGLGHVAESQQRGFEVIAQAQADGVASLNAYRQEVIEPFRQDLASRYAQQMTMAETMLRQIDESFTRLDASNRAVTRVSETLETSVQVFTDQMTTAVRNSMAEQNRSLEGFRNTSQQRVDEVTRLFADLLRTP